MRIIKTEKRNAESGNCNKRPERCLSMHTDDGPALLPPTCGRTPYAWQMTCSMLLQASNGKTGKPRPQNSTVPQFRPIPSTGSTSDVPCMYWKGTCRQQEEFTTNGARNQKSVSTSVVRHSMRNQWPWFSAFEPGSYHHSSMYHSTLLSKP